MSSARPDLSKFPVLVVEDDPAICGYSVQILRAKGYTVHSASSAEVAMVGLAALPGDVSPILVVDNCLPKMTGLDLVERAREVRVDFEVILVTAFADREALMRSVELGVFRCITKPFHMEDLTQAVTGAREELAARRELRQRTIELAAKVEELRQGRRKKRIDDGKPHLPEGLRMLFVDDDALVQRAFRRLFPTQKVCLAGNATTALDEIARQAPDVIVCDMHMPGMDGVSFYAELAVRHPGLEQRVLFVSGTESKERLTPAPFLRKPFSQSELEQSVLRMIEA